MRQHLSQGSYYICSENKRLLTLNLNVPNEVGRSADGLLVFAETVFAPPSAPDFVHLSQQPKENSQEVC